MADEQGDRHGNEAGDRDGAAGASGSVRLAAAPDDTRKPRLPFPVVGIGASAGGLEAYTEFLQATPADAGLAYVLIQHLPPDRESLLAELLDRVTAMPVREVEDGQTVEPNHVYVIRPGHTLTIKDGRLRLGPQLAARGHGRPVDDFFRSLAEEQQQRAIAVVFSGMGSNGTAGAQAIKSVGGLVIAQEPESARFPSMPRSLIDAHLSDFILRPAEVPEVLVRYADHPYVAGDGAAAATVRDEQALADVLAVLRTRTRHDFSGYRKPTILRRARRRMGLNQFTTMAEYVRALRQTPAEVSALADDLLIHVTGFFRDPEAWAVLREKVIEPLTVERADGAEVRCWVAACATGEEAYTLAMLLVEAAEAHGKHFDIKVFATDMAERALGAARAGTFPNGIESEVTPERLARFFDKDDSFYRVKKDLRELIIFAPQNVLQDPPFSRLDIATCRNLLIYLEPETQRRVLAVLHFGLREGGVLMLGTSESVGPAEADFEPIDKRHRLFRRIGPTRSGTLDLPALVSTGRELRHAVSTGGLRSTPHPQPVHQIVSRALLEGYTPAAVAVDAAGHVIHVHGNTARYLTLPPGGPTHDLLALANDHIRGAVRTAFHRVADTQTAVTVRDGLIDTPTGRVRVEVGAAPLAPRGSPPLYLITFRDIPEPVPTPPPDGDPTAAERMAQDLTRVRNELQSALEEMQTSNEELKASHEEATSLNEELQSTNEELETSKEEMQSLNEELVTVNAQLQAKMAELEATANDLGSLLTSTDIAVLFLDPKFRIRRFTPATRDLLDLIPSDVGRPLADLRRKFADPDLLADAQTVLEKLVPVEEEVRSDSGRVYLRRVLPYRTQDNRIDGVVVAFVDVTERKRAEDALRASERRLRRMVNVPRVGMLTFDYAGTLLEANDAFLDMVGFARAEFAAQRYTWRDFTPPEYIPVSEQIFRQVRETGRGGPYEKEYFCRDGSRLWLMFVAADLGDGTIAEYAVDISDRKRAEDALRASEEQFRRAIEDAPTPVIMQAEDGQVLQISRTWTELTGYALADVPTADAWLTRAYGPGAEAVRSHMRELFQGNRKTLGVELALCTRNGAERHWSFSASAPGTLRDGRRFLVGMAVDITDRKRAEEALKASEERLRLALNAARMGIWTLDVGTGMQMRDANLNILLGLDATDTTQPFDEFLTHVHPEDRATLRAAFAASTGEGRPLRAEFRVIRPDGSIRWLRDQGDVFSANGEAGHMTGACVDVTDRREAEEALKASEERLRLILESATDFAILTLAPDHTVTTWSPGAAHLFGYSEAEIIGQTGDVIFTPEERAAGVPETEAATAQRDGRAADERWHVRKDGSRFYATGVLTPLGPGGATGFVKVLRDLTDRKRMEDELRATRDELEARVAERTAELEAEIAARAAVTRQLGTAQEDERRRMARELHDAVGQFLTGLALALKAVGESGGLSSDAAARLAETRQTADALGKEVHSLAVRLRPTSLDDLGLEAALGQLVTEWASRTGVRADFQSAGVEPGRLPTEVETTVYRVMQEALTNVARHAQATQVSVVVTRPDGAVTAVVEDNGIGFDPSVSPRGRLGLIGMRERAELVGGEVEIESRPGAGTTVLVRIPVPTHEENGA